MTKIKLYCQGAAARAKVEGSITAGAVGIPVEIECDSAWDGLTRTLVCMSADQRIPIVLGQTVPTVAWEVLIPGMHLYLGLEGRNAAGDIVIPTTWADCGRVQPSAEGSHTGLPTPTEMEQLLMLAASAGEDGRKALALCEALKNTLISREDVETAVANWLASNGDTLSGLSAVGAAADQVPVAAGDGSWHWKDLPEPGETYDDTALRSAITALDARKVSMETFLQTSMGKLDIQQSPMDAGKVLTINDSGVVVPGQASGTPGSLPDNVVLFEETDDDADDQTLENLIMDKLTLESDGEYIYLLCGSAELGRVEAGSGGGTGTVYCTGITLGETELTMDVGDETAHELSVSVSPSDCTQSVRWFSSDDRVVTVSGTGSVTAVGEGTATVTVKCGAHSASVSIRVKQKQKTFSVVMGGIECTGNTLTHNTGRSDRASVSPTLIYVGDGAKVTVRCSDASFYFGPTGYLIPDVTTDITATSVVTSGRISEPGWRQGEYTVTATGWTHLAVTFRYGSGSAINAQVLERIQNAVTIEVE